MLITVNDLQGYVHQFHLVGDASLMSMANNPLVTINVNDVVGCQFLHINKREGSEADKDEDVANESQVVVLKLMRYDGFQFVFSQELPFLAVLALASGKAERVLI